MSSWLASPAPVQRGKKKKKAKAKPKPKPTLQVTIDDKGKVHANDAAAALIGFKDSSGTTFVEEPTDKATSTFDAVDGTRVTLNRLHQVDVALQGADHAAVVTFERNVIDAVLTEGETGIVVDTSRKPVAPTSMPASVRNKMVSDARLELSDGDVWVLMTFPDGTLQWVAPNHSKAEYAKAETEINAEAENLPDEKKAEFAEVLRMVSVVRVIEGGFGSTSGKGDDTASLGIFQWGMKKNQSADAGSLGKFFYELKDRATGSQAKKEDARTDEDNLYINAWKQCTDAGLDVRKKNRKIQITLNGNIATGKDVESTMKGTMAKDDLRTYQLIAAIDWINDMKAKIVMPGYFGKKYVGNGYRMSGKNNSTVTLKGPTRSVMLAMPGDHLTVGQACESEQALAVIADLLPNRPNYVETAVWRAESPSDANTQIAALLASIEAAQPAEAPAAGVKKKKKKAKAAGPPALTEATVVDKEDYAKIRALLWPTVAVDDDTLISNFEAAAIELYKGERKQGGASSYKSRARRLATAHVVAW